MSCVQWTGAHHVDGGVDAVGDIVQAPGVDANCARHGRRAAHKLADDQHGVLLSAVVSLGSKTAHVSWSLGIPSLFNLNLHLEACIRRDVVLNCLLYMASGELAACCVSHRKERPMF